MSFPISRQQPVELGSGLAWIKEVKSDGTDLGTPDTYHNLPYVKDSELAWDFSSSQAKTETDESNNSYTILITAGGSKASFKGNFLTVARAGLHTFQVKSRTKYYQIIKQINSTLNADGTYELCVLPICILAGGVSFKNGTTVPFEFALQQAPATITVAHTGLVASLTGTNITTVAADITVAAGDYAGFGTGV